MLKDFQARRGFKLNSAAASDVTPAGVAEAQGGQLPMPRGRM